MLRLLSTALLASYASALVATPLITPAPTPELLKRQDSVAVCGYFVLDGSTDSLFCDAGSTCMVAMASDPAIGYCSGAATDIPITTIYPYGDWPLGGCDAGAQCCPSLTPAAGKLLFDAGNTVFLACGPVPFTYTGFFSAHAGFATPAPNAAIPTPTSSTSPGETGGTNTAFKQADQTTTTAPTSTSPTPTPTPTPTPNTTEIVIVVVGGAVALVSGSVFLYFLYKMVKMRHAARIYTPPPEQWQYSPSSSSIAMTTGGVQKKNKMGGGGGGGGDGLKKWAKVATIVSPVLAVVGLAVAIYFGVRPGRS